MRFGKILNRAHLRELGKILGIEMTGRTANDEEEVSSMKKGDRMLFLFDHARSTKTEMRESWETVGCDWDIGWFEMMRFADTFVQYKKDRRLIDFTDMLETFIVMGEPAPVKVSVIDEAQDLTPLQWDVVDTAFGDCDRQYIAGDDDQAIYEWAGADVKKFLHLDEDQREVLPVSYRLPKKIFDFSVNVVRKIENRYRKDWTSSNEEGTVQRISDASELDLGVDSGTWLLLTRNVCFFPYYKDECTWQEMPFSIQKVSSIDQGDLKVIRCYENLRKGRPVNPEEATSIGEVFEGKMKSLPKKKEYHLDDLFDRDPGLWHESMTGIPATKRAYYLGILRGGDKLMDDRRIRIDTIHGVKGGEADNVVLMTDVTRGTEENMEKNLDSEIRVFYVGMTRAKKNLYLLEPQTNRHIGNFITY